MLAFAAQQILDRLVLHFEALQLDDTEVFVALSPNLILRELHIGAWLGEDAIERTAQRSLAEVERGLARRSEGEARTTSPAISR
jgi:hypothetical protein